MDPINYQAQLANPFAGVMQGLGIGQQIGQAQAQRAAQEQAILQAQAERTRQEEMQKDLAELAQGGASAKKFAELIIKYPQLSEHFKRGYDILKHEQQTTTLRQMSEVLSALENNQPEIAMGLLNQQAAAARNSQDEQGADAAERMAKFVGASPAMATAAIKMSMAAIQGPDKFIEEYSKFDKLPGEVALGQAEAQAKQAEAAGAPRRVELESQNIESQIAAREAQQRLDYAKMQQQERLAKIASDSAAERGQKFTDSQRNAINASSEGSIDADTAASRYSELADRISREMATGGVAGSGWEAIKKVTGKQDYVSVMRTDYDRLINSAIIDSLPKGPASDKDIAMARRGFLPSNASAEMIASFLRGMAKIKRYESVYLATKAAWHASVGHLGQAPDNIVLEIEGQSIPIPKGTTYLNFAPSYLKARKKEIEGTAPTAEEQPAPTPRTAPAQPVAAAPRPSEEELDEFAPGRR